MHLHDAFDILRSDDGGPARLLLSDDAAQVDDTVANDYAQAEGAPVVLIDSIDDAIENMSAVGSGTCRARLATAWSRLARVTMPTSLSPRSTGSRLTFFSSMRSTTAGRGVSSVTVTGTDAMISEILRLCWRM